MNLHLTATDLAVVLTPVTSLLARWLRLSWRIRQEHARHGTLVDLAHTLRPGCELEETSADGTHLRITLMSADIADPDDGRQDIGAVATLVGDRGLR